MTGIERLKCMLAGRAPDRWPFVPSVYEHGASLIGRGPGEVSRDPAILAAAALEAYRLYAHDIVTVGIDIYNVEAEAFGCELSGGEGSSIPGVTTHPLAGEAMGDPDRLGIPQPSGANRLALIAEAARRVTDEIGREVWVYGCMGGPFSQAVELRGFEELITDIYTSPERVHKLLGRTTELSLQQAERLSRQGCGVYLFESWATLPLIDPGIFGDFVVPYNRKVISAVGRFRTPPAALIMGGDTSVLIDFFLEAGTSLVVADFNTDFDFVKAKTRGRNVLVRGCVDPKAIERGEWRQVGRSVEALACKAAGMKSFVWGCGCVSYNTPKEHVLRFKDMCLRAGGAWREG